MRDKCFEEIVGPLQVMGLPYRYLGGQGPHNLIIENLEHSYRYVVARTGQRCYGEHEQTFKATFYWRSLRWRDAGDANNWHDKTAEEIFSLICNRQDKIDKVIREE